MRQILLSALLASSLALPAGAQFLDVQGVLVEPRNPTTSDHIRLTMVGVEGCPTTFQEPVYHGDTVILNIAMAEDCVTTPLPVPFRRTFEIGPRPAGLNWIEVRIEDLPFGTRYELFEVSEDTAQLALGENDRFEVLARWSNPRDGSFGSGHARRLAQDSGAFWFFSPDNLEVTVKVIDGRAVNGHWWVFIASMTDLQLEIEVAQEGGPVKTYVQTAGANRNFIDTSAFGEEPAAALAASAEITPSTPAIVIEPEHPTSADSVRVEVAVLNTEPDIAFTGVEGHSIFFDYSSWVYPADRPLPPHQRFTAEKIVGPLAPGVYTVDVRRDLQHNFSRTFEVAEPSPQLLLQDTGDSSFTVSVQLEPPLNGPGYGVPLTRESGYFWFFDPDNIELTVKILDGRAVNGKYWVFLSSMTDVAFTVEVQQCPTNPQIGAPCYSKTYEGTQGVNRNIIDVNFQGF